MTSIASLTTPDDLRLRRQIARLQAQYPLWARACYRILTKAGDTIPLALNGVQRAIGRAEQAQLRARGKSRIYVLKGRQAGISTDQQARNLFAIWAHRGRTVLTLSDNRENTDRIFAITLRAVREFPPQLLPTLGARETREIGFPGRDSRFYTDTAGAKMGGVSITLWRCHCSEFALWDQPRTTLGKVTPALVPSGSSVVLETTAGTYDSDGHQVWRDAQDGANGYAALFFPWWECDPLHYRLPLVADDELGPLEPDEATLEAVHGLTLEQIKWRRDQMREIGRGEFMRQYPEDPETCWLTAGGLYYDPDVLKELLARAPEPRERRQTAAGTVAIYGESKPGDAFVVIGADTAEGVAGDRSAWVARSFPSWTLLAAFADNRIVPDDFADSLDAWGRRVALGGHPALLVVEKNLHGITVLRRLRDHHRYPTDRIYHRQPADTPHAEKLDRIGWATTAESKPLMLNAGYQLLTAAQRGDAGVPPMAAIRDAFGVHRNERGSADLGGKDLLVAEMLAWLGRGQPPTPAPPRRTGLGTAVYPLGTRVAR